ncbi:MAG: hypothetical protein JNM34_05825 [Chthonomonadaceae bacterium]|nr:hypothetical protein [Chthonomonadaceae bacterium]
MNSPILNRLLSGLVATVTIVSFSYAQNDPLQKRVDLFLRGADLNSAIQALTLQTGLQFIVQAGDKTFGKIDLNLSQRTAEEAIKYMCEAAGAYAERDANGVFIIRAGKPDVKTVPTSNDVAVVTPKIMRRIRVMRGDPENIYSILTKAVAYDPDNGMRTLNQMGQDRMGVFNMKMPSAQIVNNNSPIIFPKGVPSESGSSVSLPGEAANQVGGGGQPGGGGTGLGGQNNGGGVTGLQPGQGSLVPQGIDKIIYDPTDNSFIVTGSEDAIRELERLIEQFDQQPKQVVIKVEFVSTTNKHDRAFGIDWNYARGSVFAGVRAGEFARSGDPVFFNYATGNLATRLRALMNDGWGRTVSAPLVRTLNNQTAFVGQQIVTYIFIPVINNGPGGQQTVFQPFPVPVQTQLVLRPRINNDNTIAMTLAPNIATITGFSVGPDGQQLPNITNQTLNLATIVKNGETIALAGFTTKNDNYAVKRIPVLSDLPIIGQLFRGRNDSKDSSELVVFVTPNIVQEDELGLQP